MLAALNLRGCVMISATVRGAMSGIIRLSLLHCKRVFDLDLSFGIVHYLHYYDKKDGQDRLGESPCFKRKFASHYWSWLPDTYVGILCVFNFSFPFSLMHMHSSISFLSIYFNLSYAIHNRKGEHWKHEYASEMMFDYLVRDNNIPIPEKDQRFIKALIAGEPSQT